MPSYLPRIVAGAAGLAAVLSTGAVLTPHAAADPGHPGTPAAPVVLLHEAFSDGLSAGELVSLDDYGTANYTADPAWLSGPAGNGLVVDGTTSNADMVAAGYTNAPLPIPGGGDHGDELRSLATALGQLNGTSPATANHAVTAYTDQNPGANLVEFQTRTPLNLPANGRFLTISANVGVENCVRATAPLLKFYLVNAAGENAVNTAALNPCVGAPSDAALATTLTGGNAVLFDGNQVGIVLRNENGSGGGNDHAYDDIRVLDVTPQLDKDFASSQTIRRPGDVANLVFTVTNTSELGAKNGWSFTDQLARGLAVAGTPSTDCAAATIDAAPGATSIEVTAGSLAAGAASCTLTVPVTSTAPGTFTNSAANITSVGLDAPGSTQVTYVAAPRPSLKLVKSASPERVSRAGQVVRYRFKVTNTGNVVVRKVRIVEGSFSGTGRLSKPVCPRASLTPGQSEICTATYKVTKADLKTKRIRNTASAAGVGPDGAAVRSKSSTAVVRVGRLPGAPQTGARPVQQ
ncbi:hypothetical protein [Pimelobacter simplex]|uniref:DUF7507 domain-containing protein n=1 Tax=Nocardioides simplex TaxID=2045 RepID=UPI003AACA7B0